MLALALTAALLLPGLAVALPACGMDGCGRTAAAAPHGCCPAAGATLAAACCGKLPAPPALAPKGGEGPAAPHAAAADLAAFAPSLTAPGRAPAGPSLPPRTFDPLDQGCILRI